jgi:DNA-binding response OmpR family regulator
LAERLTAVVAEDNRDLREYLVRHLSHDYRVLATGNGQEALAMVNDETPDIVVADIMMPGMDGLSLCREIRSTPETDFIPVILLTAKATGQERLEGLGTGADDYLTKPFDIGELQLRMKNLLEARARLRTRLAAEYSLSSAVAEAPVPDSADKVFLRRVYDVLLQHAPDEDFTVEQFADEMNLSRMHLYRRLQEIVGKPPTELIMEYRLKRAAELLAARTGTVSEIAYGVGFKSLSHFTRRFRERFKCTPSEYRAQSDEASRRESAQTG